MTTYVHDCDSCVPLGTYEYNDVWDDGTIHHKVVDLYVCQDSVLARDGDEAHEYASSLMQIVLYAGHEWIDHSPLREAFRRFSDGQGDAFKAAVEASHSAYAADKKLSPRAGDAAYIDARDAHATALFAHRNLESGPHRRFHEMVANEHGHRLTQLRLCLP